VYGKSKAFKIKFCTFKDSPVALLFFFFAAVKVIPGESAVGRI
jgi:hypothetical protein